MPDDYGKVSGTRGLHKEPASAHAAEPCNVVEWRMAVRHGLLEGLVPVGVAQHERAAQVLGRAGHARLTLE